MSEALNNILITGATSGIGRATALQLANRGKKVFVTGRNTDKLAELTGEAEFAGQHTSDLTTPHAAEELFSAASEALGDIDAVVHAAGVGLIKPTLETTDAEFSRLLNINTRVTFLVALEAARHMSERKRGRFVTLPGILGKAVMKNATAYIASKYAVTGMIKAMTQEFQRSGVQFCLLHLGGVDSPFWDQLAMKVQREKMIPVETAADAVVHALELPSHLVLSEMTIQPESHQL